MQKEIFAALCTEIYYSGKVTNDKTFGNKDFETLIDVARGKVILANYWQARKMELSIEESGFLNSYIESIDNLKIAITSRGKEVILPKKPVTLPHGFGVFEVSPNGDAFNSEFIRIDAGAAWTTKGDHEETFFEILSNKIRLYNCPDCLKTVSVMMVPETSDELASDILFDILNMIFGIMLKVKGFPVDMQDDSNPNVMMVNKKIAEATIQ